MLPCRPPDAKIGHLKNSYKSLRMPETPTGLSHHSGFPLCAGGGGKNCEEGITTDKNLVSVLLTRSVRDGVSHSQVMLAGSASTSCGTLLRWWGSGFGLQPSVPKPRLPTGSRVRVRLLINQVSQPRKLGQPTAKAVLPDVLAEVLTDLCQD